MGAMNWTEVGRKTLCGPKVFSHVPNLATLCPWVYLACLLLGGRLLAIAGTWRDLNVFRKLDGLWLIIFRTHHECLHP
jgi:hypothetical protein